MDPALQAAVVDVGELADNSERTLALRGEVVVFGARYTVQFWTKGPWGWCEEILDRRFRAGWGCIHASCQFRISPHAKWMTITASPENVMTRWILR